MRFQCDDLRGDMISFEKLYMFKFSRKIINSLLFSNITNFKSIVLWLSTVI